MNNPIDLNDCWLFAGWFSPSGYGTIIVQRRKEFIHRVVYENFVGEIPQGFQIDHLCSVRACINPKHLEAVTPRVNVLRSSGIAAVNARKTHCIRGHEFTPNNTYRYSNNKRMCKACASLRANTDKERERKRIATLRWYEQHREIADIRAKKYRQAHRENLNRAAYKRRDPIKARACQAVNNAIAAGRFEKEPCFQCGEDKADFHHTDGYEKENWFVGVWVCRKHHHAIHKEMRRRIRLLV